MFLCLFPMCLYLTVYISPLYLPFSVFCCVCMFSSVSIIRHACVPSRQYNPISAFIVCFASCFYCSPCLFSVLSVVCFYCVCFHCVYASPGLCSFVSKLPTVCALIVSPCLCSIARCLFSLCLCLTVSMFRQASLPSCPYCPVSAFIVCVASCIYVSPCLCSVLPIVFCCV